MSTTRDTIESLPSAHRLIERVVEDVIGAEIAEHLAGRVSRCVDKTVDERGLDGPMGYLTALQADDGQSEELLDDLLATILVHETFFYRFATQLKALEGEVLRPLAAGRLKGVIKIWSAGCSNGPEAYTLAILGALAVRDLRESLVVDVLGTDVCQKFIDEARGASYAMAKLKELPRTLRNQFLVDGGRGSFVVAEEIKRNVRFRQRNLLDPPPEFGFDIISCRNVLMYLRPSARREALEHLAAALEPKGVLLVGHSESLRDMDDLFVPHDRLALGIYHLASEGDADHAKPRSQLSPIPATQEPKRSADNARRPSLGDSSDRWDAPAPLGSLEPSTLSEERSPTQLDRGRQLLVLVGEYDQERCPELLERLKLDLGDAIEKGSDVIIRADLATCLDDASATLIARAARAIASKGQQLSVIANRQSVRRWAQRNRLPLRDEEDCS